MRPLETDPAAYPWHGIAAHGNTPFSCTLITHIIGNLWVGGCIDGLKLADDFEYVVSLYPWEQYRLGPNTERVELRLYDSEVEDEAIIHEIVERAFEYVQKGKTLIHCQAGLNRSGMVAALVLMREGWLELSAQEAIDLLREKRTTGVLCNPHFVELLLSQ